MERRLNEDKKRRISIYLPASMRDLFNLKNGDRIDVDTDGTRIILTPKKQD
jgi:AbrB family looped-hinge helix DNA binding protein